MSMPLAGHISALMEKLTAADVQALPPAARRRFADQCRYLAGMAEPPASAPKTGVLFELKRQPAEWR